MKKGRADHMGYSANISTSASQFPAAATVWLLQGARLGDNQQVLALGAALQARFGWRLVVKQFKFISGRLPSPDPAHALDHVDLAGSDPMMAYAGNGWPDLVIAIGRRMAPVARWIRAQNMPQGLHVQLGRFQAPFQTVDLLVSTAQYGLPPASNMLQLSLPITAPRKPDAAAMPVMASMADIAGPRIALLVGGPSSPIGFGLADGERLLREGLAFAAARKGTLLVATSPRTPREVTDLLRRDLPAPHRLFPFEAGRADNPYPALLAHSDAFIVTNDSVSMVADAALTGREVRLFELPVTPPRPLWQPSWPLAHWVGRRRNMRLVRGLGADWLDRWFEAEVRRAGAQPTRYVPTIMNRLLREKHLALLSDPSPPRTDIALLVAEELDMVSWRIMALVMQRRAAALRDRMAQGERPPAALQPASSIEFGLPGAILADPA